MSVALWLVEKFDRDTQQWQMAANGKLIETKIFSIDAWQSLRTHWLKKNTALSRILS